MSIREKILSADDLPKKRVELAHPYNTAVEARGVTTGDRLTLVAKHSRQAVGADGSPTSEVDMASLLPDLVMLTTFDPDTGQLVFEPTDRKALEGKSAIGLEELFNTALELSGFAGSEKELAKNSEPTATTSSPSE